MGILRLNLRIERLGLMECTDWALYGMLQVTLTVPEEVQPQAGVSHRPPQRQVHWRYFYAGGQRHVTEAIEGNRCAFCHMLCLSFMVRILCCTGVRGLI